MSIVRKWGFFSVTGTLILIICLLVFQTNPVTTKEDKETIKQLISSYNIPKAKEQSFEKQIKQISLVQKAVIGLSGERYFNRNNHRAKGAAELYQTKNGICYDNSYVMEQVFNELGYEYRHVFWLFIPVNQSCFSTLLSKKAESHAAIEVKTQKGWMYVESLMNFIGIDQEKNVLSATALNLPYWDLSVKFPSVETPYYLNKKACIVYGLYSRNGKLFPPDMPVPDYNCRQLLYNFTNE